MNFLLTQEDFMSILRRDILQIASVASFSSCWTSIFSRVKYAEAIRV
jgi:hypothetical protein